MGLIESRFSSIGMITKVIRKIVGSRNERQIRHMQKTVTGINGLEPESQKLSDAGLRARTDEFRERRAAGEASGW